MRNPRAAFHPSWLTFVESNTPIRPAAFLDRNQAVAEGSRAFLRKDGGGKITG
jgi:hypothetical protein